MKSTTSTSASQRTVLGHRRFTCLSATLVRVEFSATGIFDDRRSLVAYPQQIPQAFVSQRVEGDWTIFDAGGVQVWTRANETECDRNTLEMRWSDGRMLQIWRPDDRDYQNLGGTLRSLDQVGTSAAQLDGVHVATMESADVVSTAWPVWMLCEVDPLYAHLHPDAPEALNKTIWLQGARDLRNSGRYFERNFNWYKSSRKFGPGIISESGYHLLNDSLGAVLDADNFPVERLSPGYQDWYFFAYAKDFKQALHDFRLLSGPASLPRLKSFGIMFSRWPAFTELNPRPWSVSLHVADIPCRRSSWIWSGRKRAGVIGNSTLSCCQSRSASSISHKKKSPRRGVQRSPLGCPQRRSAFCRLCGSGWATGRDPPACV